MGFIKNLINKIKNKNINKEISKSTQVSKVQQDVFDKGLHKSSIGLKLAFDELSHKYHKIDQNLINDIEEMLIKYDVGTGATTKILKAIEQEIKFQKVDDLNLIKQIIIDKIFVYYIHDSIINSGLNIIANKTNIILVSGANGVGKTTSIAKIANFLLNKKMSVCLVAGDTYRTGAVEQLQIWADRLNIRCFKPKFQNQDPCSVIFDGINWARKNNINVVLCDTSGRLESRKNLMFELSKIDKVIKKFDSNQPCESLLVLDALVGQTGILQAEAFNDVTKITGIVLTKMDSTSHGGIILAIKDKFNIPVKFIGFGESIVDLQEFDLEKYILGLTKDLNFL